MLFPESYRFFYILSRAHEINSATKEFWRIGHQFCFTSWPSNFEFLLSNFLSTLLMFHRQFYQNSNNSFSFDISILVCLVMFMLCMRQLRFLVTILFSFKRRYHGSLFPYDFKRHNFVKAQFSSRGCIVFLFWTITLSHFLKDYCFALFYLPA